MQSRGPRTGSTPKAAESRGALEASWPTSIFARGRRARPDRLGPDFGDAIRRALVPRRPSGLAGELLRRVSRRWAATMRRIAPLGGCSTGNRVRLFCDGDEAFAAMWEAIERARERVWLETYIFEADEVGRHTMARLIAAARRGCDVVLIVDAFGSHKLDDDFTRSLREAGGQVLYFNPFRFFRRMRLLLRRDHRKILVVDDRVAFCGGMNIGADYAGAKHGTARFRDTHLCVYGPAAADLAVLVAGAARACGVELVPLAARPPRREGTLLQVLESNVWRKRTALQRTLRYVLARAVQRCYIATPYFVPPRRLKRAIRKAARRGVDVRILTAGRSDVPMVALAGQHVYGEILRAGARIFEYGANSGRILHSKTVTIDGVYAVVGSFNFDTWSSYRNLEVNVGALSPELASALERQFLSDAQDAREVKLEDVLRRGVLRRLLSYVAYGVSRL